MPQGLVVLTAGNLIAEAEGFIPRLALRQANKNLIKPRDLSHLPMNSGQLDVSELRILQNVIR